MSLNISPKAYLAMVECVFANHLPEIVFASTVVIVGNSIRLASEVESGDALG